MYLLDTNVCIRFLNGKSQSLIDTFKQKNPRDIYLCSIVKAELFYGAFKSNNPLKTLRRQKEFCDGFSSFHFDDAAAQLYGEIRADLEKRGQIIGPNDLLIAATAMANSATLVTHNEREFKRVDGLVFEDWEENVGASASKGQSGFNE